MERWFELWDAENASLVGTFDTVAAALAIVRRSIAAYGEESVASLVLTEEDDGEAGPRSIASGPALADLARKDLVPLAAGDQPR